MALTLASVPQPGSRGRLPEREHLSQALGRGPPPPGCGPEEGEMECGVGCVVEPDAVLSRQQTPERKATVTYPEQCDQGSRWLVGAPTPLTPDGVLPEPSDAHGTRGEEGGLETRHRACGPAAPQNSPRDS